LASTTSGIQDPIFLVHFHYLKNTEASSYEKTGHILYLFNEMEYETFSGISGGAVWVGFKRLEEQKVPKHC
jgi:hypothetical protein